MGVRTVSRLATLVFALVLAAAGSAEAEKLTVALSTPEVTINSNFTGTTVTVFGVIDRDARSVSGVGGYDIAVLLLGPSRDGGGAAQGTHPRHLGERRRGDLRRRRRPSTRCRPR